MSLGAVLLALKILQFYATPDQIFVGDQALICYGVEDATSVRIDPEVDRVSAALSRCVAVSPKRDTTYKLTATSQSGEQSVKTLRIAVKPIPRPAPVILSFTAAEAKINPGGSTKLCFRVDNAISVRVDPPVQELGAAVSGCFVVAPQKTTTYSLIAEGGGKPVRKQVTVTVP